MTIMTDDVKICPESGHKRWLDVGYINCSSHCLRMTDKREKATKVIYKHAESITKQSIFVEYCIFWVYSSLEEALSFDGARSQMNTIITSLKSTKRKVKLKKFASGTPWLRDLLRKHWFTSSVWKFCRWVADVPAREMSQVARSEKKRLFSEATSPAQWSLFG